MSNLDGGGVIIIHGHRSDGSDGPNPFPQCSPADTQAAIDALATAAMTNTAVANVRNALVAAKTFAAG